MIKPTGYRRIDNPATFQPVPENTLMAPKFKFTREALVGTAFEEGFKNQFHSSENKPEKKEELIMPEIFNVLKLEYKKREAPLPEFLWKSSPRLAKLVGAENLEFDIRSLAPGQFSFPYHFHRNAEELFYIISGKAMLRTTDGFKEITKEDIIFFEKGPSGAHQVFNHSDAECVYLDLRTTMGIDVCEYPDSKKISILPYLEIFESSAKVDYYKGEEDVKAKWPGDIVNTSGLLPAQE